jgi:hypothetical protein
MHHHSALVTVVLVAALGAAIVAALEVVVRHRRGSMCGLLKSDQTRARSASAGRPPSCDRVAGGASCEYC